MRIDWGALMQEAARRHLDEIYREDEDEQDCGCQTCTIREVLTAIWPLVDVMVNYESRAQCEDCPYEPHPRGDDGHP
jgi:ribosomal protein L37AE/L43A